MALRFPAWKGILVLGALACPLAAQSPRPDEKIAEDLLNLLNTPVTGASKREQRLIDSPQAIEVLTGDDLRLMGVYRLQDALKLMTSVDLLEADNGFSVVGLRGIMQEGQPRTVQILVDGVPMYNPLGGPIDVSNLPVPLEAIDRIEVVRGPSSTLYGANAVVGVIAITTRQGAASGGYVRASAADKGTTRGGGVAGLSQGAWSVLGSYQGYAMGASGFETHYLGRPGQLRSYQDAPTSLSPVASPWVGSDAAHGVQAFGSAAYKAGDTTAWVHLGGARKWNGPESFFAYRRNESRFAQAGWRQAWSPTFATEVRAHRLELKHDLSASPYLALAFEDPGFLSEYRWVDESISQVEIQANWEASATMHFVFGADTRELKVGNARFVGIPNGAQERASGGFATLDWTLAPGWALTAGVRAENESLGGSRLSPRLAVVWNPDGNSALRLGYFTSTRSPQVLEQRVDLRLFTGRFYPAPATPTPPNIPVYARLLPNPDLKPEKTVNVELGYRHTFGRVTLDATLYRMQLTSQVNQVALDPYVEAIETRPPGVGQVYGARLNVPNQFRNAGDATNTGFEVALTWQLAKGWQAGCNGAWQRFLKDQVQPGDPMGDRFAYAPTSKANAWLRVKEGRLGGYLALQHVGGTTAEALQAQGNPFFEARPAFLQVHAQVGWDLWKGSQVAVYVRNGAKAFTLQGATGPERPTAYQAARREAGLTLGWQF